MPFTRWWNKTLHRGHFEAIGQTDAHLWQAVALALAGFLLIYVIEFHRQAGRSKISAPKN